MWLAIHGHQKHIIWSWYGFSRAKKCKTMSNNLKITNVSKYHFKNLYIHGKVLQHENALSRILTSNWFFVKKINQTFNIPRVTGWSGHLSFLTSTCPSSDREDRLSVDTCPCTTQNVGHPPMWGTGPWVRGMGTWHHRFFIGPLIY
jgi:hypothetical protein